MRALEPWVATPLETFLAESAARLTLLMTSSGQVVAQHGFSRSLDVMTAAALGAGIVASTEELARLMGAARFDAIVHNGQCQSCMLAAFTTPRTRDMAQTSWPQAIWIGAAQILSAAFPGTSRSMATIAAGQTAGMSRSAAREFSFFLSIPIMFAATGFKLLQAVRGKSAGEPIAMDAHKWIVLAIGFVISFFVAWGVIAWFMAWVRQRGFTPFAVYRILLGLLVLLVLRNHVTTTNNAPPPNVALNPHTPAPYHVTR